MDAWMDGWMHAWMHAWMDVCMYVHIKNINAHVCRNRINDI